MELANVDQLRDPGWTSPWHLSANGEHRIVTQSTVVGAGDLALEMGSAAALERSFPPVSRGILKIEMSVRLQKATIDIEDANASVLKGLCRRPRGQLGLPLALSLCLARGRGQHLPALLRH